MHPKALAYANRVATVSAWTGVLLADAFLAPLGDPSNDQRKTALMHFTGFCWMDAIGVCTNKVRNRDSRRTLHEVSRNHTSVALALELRPGSPRESVAKAAASLDDWLFGLLKAWGDALRAKEADDWDDLFAFTLHAISLQPAFASINIEASCMKVGLRLGEVIPLIRKESLAAARYARPALVRIVTGTF